MSALRQRSYEDLEAENAWLRQRLGEETEAEDVARLAAAFGLYPYAARVLLILARRRGHLASCGFLDEALPPRYGHDRISAKNVPVHVCRVRARLGRAAIETSYGLGYRLTLLGLAQVDRVLAGER